MVTYLKMFPSKNGISNNLSPSETILGYPNPYHNKLRIKLGAYAQVQIGTSNNTNQRTVGAIELCSAKKRVGYYFMSVSRVTNQQKSNTKGRLPVHEGKTTRNDQVLPNF